MTRQELAAIKAEFSACIHADKCTRCYRNSKALIAEVERLAEELDNIGDEMRVQHEFLIAEVERLADQVSDLELSLRLADDASCEEGA